MPWSPASLVLVAAGVDAHRDIGRLLVDMNGHIGVLPMESVLLVADLLDRFAGDLLHPRGIDLRRSAHLAAEHDSVGRAQGFDAAA